MDRHVQEFSGDKLARRRRERGLTQVDLALAVGVGYSTIQQWEYGRTEPTATKLARLAEALDAEIAAFFVPANACASMHAEVGHGE